MDKHRLTEGPLAKPLLLFALPLVAGMLGHALFNLIDVLLVGRLGAPAVAAVHLASVVNFIPMILFNGVGVSTVAFVSRAAGAGDQEEVRRVARDSLALALLAGIVLGLAGYWTATPVIELLATGGEAKSLAVSCLEIASLGTVTMFLLLQVTAIFRALGDGFWPMLLLIGANALNILLCLVLIYGWGPIDAMGVTGSLWATVISRGLFGVLGLWALTRRGLHRPAQRWQWFSFWRRSRELLALGVPSGMQIFMRVIAVLAITALIQKQDRLLQQNLGAAAYGIGVRLDMLALFGAAGWGAAASTVVGMNLGAGEPARARRGAWILVALCTGTMIVIGVFFFQAAEWLMRFVGMNPPAEQTAFGAEYLRAIVFSYPFVAVSIVLASAMNGAGVTRLPLLLDFLAFAGVFLPVSFWAMDRFGPQGLWWLLIAVNAALAAAYALCFNRGSWIRKKLRNEELEPIS